MAATIVVRATIVIYFFSLFYYNSSRNDSTVWHSSQKLHIGEFQVPESRIECRATVEWVERNEQTFTFF